MDALQNVEAVMPTLYQIVCYARLFHFLRGRKPTAHEVQRYFAVEAQPRTELIQSSTRVQKHRRVKRRESPHNRVFGTV